MAYVTTCTLCSTVTREDREAQQRAGWSSVWCYSNKLGEDCEYPVCPKHAAHPEHAMYLVECAHNVWEKMR
jgi:hypothetical protein